MFDLLPPQDVGDPASFLAAMAMLFAEYPPPVGDHAVFEIPKRSDRPTLSLARSVLEEIYAPMWRQIERDRIKPLALPAPPVKRPTAEEIAAKLGRIPARLRPQKAVKGEPTRNDGNHLARVRADLEARRRRRDGNDVVEIGS